MSIKGQDNAAAETAEQLEVQVGRRAPYSQVGDWVLLAGIRPNAMAVYWALSAHINTNRNNTTVWPTQDMLAEILGFSRGDKIKTYLDELVAIDAIRITKTRRGMRESSLYIVNQSPPEGYAGYEDLKAFYTARRERLLAENPQVAPAPPNEGAHGPGTNHQVARVPRDGGTAVPPNEGAAAPRNGGSNETKTNKTNGNETNTGGLPPEPPAPAATASGPNEPPARRSRPPSKRKPGGDHPHAREDPLASARKRAGALAVEALEADPNLPLLELHKLISATDPDLLPGQVYGRAATLAAHWPGRTDGLRERAPA